jgi:hypothetical protein
MTKQDFIDSGYKEYVNYDKSRTADCLLQKRIRNKDNKTKYFINVYMYDFSQYPQVNIEPKIQFEAESRFNDKDEGFYTFTIHKIDDINKMEEKMDELFIKMDFINDPHNN